jgi:hypothetical protein
MQRHQDSIDDARIADNLRRTIELTELGLVLRQSVLQQGEPNGDAIRNVMREIRRAKELAWQRNPS